MHNDPTTSSSIEGGSALTWLWLTAVIIVTDQATKWWIINSLEMYEKISVLPIFNITHVHNEGAAWGILSEAGGWQRWFLTGIALIISVLLIWWMKKTPSDQKLLGASYSLILGGALGNLYDRMAYGYVEDFLAFFYNSARFPAFNVADAAITIGAMFLIYDALTAKSQDEVISD
jgi:signal peptidase II